MEEALALTDAPDGISNIVNVEPYSLRARVEAKNQREVGEAALHIPPVLAIVRSGSSIQIITGPGSEVTAHKMREQISSPQGLAQKSEGSLSLRPFRAPPSALVARFRLRIHQPSSSSLREARRMLWGAAPHDRAKPKLMRGGGL